MIHDSMVLSVPKCLRAGAALILLGCLMIWGVTAQGVAAPNYALSGQAPALEKIVLAETPQGPVTALDLLIFDDQYMHTLSQVPMEAWVRIDSAGAASFHPVIRDAVYSLAAFGSLAQRAGDWTPPADLIRAKSYGAATAVWIEQEVRPQIKVNDADIDRYYLAHPEKYLRRRSAQVRVIFQAADIPTTATRAARQAARSERVTTATREAARRVLENMEAIARQIGEGKMSFEEAARKHSQAPSAAQGGLIPPFMSGTYFSALEDQAFQITTPGMLSPVFAGPGGYYLIQLVKSWPPRDIPLKDVREDIRLRLQNDLVRPYFNYWIAKKNRDRFVRDYSATWDYLAQEAPIAQLDQLRLSRDQYLRDFGNPVEVNYETRLPEVMSNTKTWIEGEEVMSDLAAAGLTDAPWIQRARTLAAWPLRANRYYTTQIPPSSYELVEAVLATLRSNPEFSQSMRRFHLVSFDVEARATVEEPSVSTQVPSITGARTRQARETADAAKIEKANQAQTEAMASALGVAQQLATGELETAPEPTNLFNLFKTESAGKQTGDGVQALNDALKGVSYPNVRVKAADAGWRTSAPGKETYSWLKSMKVGQMSQPQVIGNHVMVYMLVEDQPVDVAAWKDKPLVLKQLAFQVQFMAIYKQEVERLKQSGQVQFKF